MWGRAGAGKLSLSLFFHSGVFLSRRQRAGLPGRHLSPPQVGGDPRPLRVLGSLWLQNPTQDFELTKRRVRRWQLLTRRHLFITLYSVTFPLRLGYLRGYPLFC